MAERNPNIPSERRREVEERTSFNEDDANRRFAEKQSKLSKTPNNLPDLKIPSSPDETDTTLSEEKQAE